MVGRVYQALQTDICTIHAIQRTKRETGAAFGGSTERGGIDAEGVDFPVSVCKHLGVLIDEVIARQGGATGCWPNRRRASPITAERQIKDDHVGVEMVLVIAVLSSGEAGCRGAPPVRVDGPEVFPDILWDTERLPRPEPNLDTVVLATREGVVSTSNIVETFAVRIRDDNLGPATLVEVDVCIAVCRDGLSKLMPFHWHSAIRESVQRNQVLTGFVNALNDVNFTTIGPVWTNRPKGWPSATTCWHVL